MNQRHPSRQQESGVVLVMALLVMLILAVVVAQLLFSTTIDHQLAENQALELQMEKLAEAAILKASVALILDADEDSMAAGGEDGGSDPLGGTGLSGLGGNSPGNQIQGQGAGGPSGRVDSLDEVWATGDIPFELGYDSELEVKILIEDEDRKMNLLVLGAQDEEWRELWRERVVRLLDILRDGQPRDLSRGEADDLVVRWENWMKGERWNRDLEGPPRAETGWMTEGLVSMQPPLSLGELVLAGGVDPSLLYGFSTGERDTDDEEWVSGLAQVLTVTSNLVLEELPDENDPNAQDPGLPEDPEEGAVFDETGQLIKEKAAPNVNNGRINVNTAPLEVLRSLFPEEEVPASAWEEYDEYRRETLEKLIEEGGWDEQEQEELGVPRYPLNAVEDLRNFEGFSETGSYLIPETWDSLRNLLTVESHVFTITVVIATQQQPTRFYVARSVVWRHIKEDDTVECIPLVPFERLATEALDLSKIREELEEWAWDY